MAQVTARKRGKAWEYGFEGAKVEGKRTRITQSGFRTKAEAMRAGIQAMTEYDNAGRRFVPAEVSFSDYLDYWYENHVMINGAANTKSSYRNAIDKHIRPALGKYRLKSLNSDILQDFINSLKKAGLSKNTVKYIKSCTSSALSYAALPCRYIPVSPMLGVRLPMFKKEPKKEYIVTPDDYEKILTAFPPHLNFHVPFMIGYYTGVRLNECFGLVWPDIDFKNRTITIHRQLSYDSKKWEFAPLKTQASYRTVFFGEKLYAVLKSEKNRQSENRLKYREYYFKNLMTENGIVFTHENQGFEELDFVCRQENGKLYNSKSLKNAIKIIHGELGIKEFHYHSLRHTHATILASHISNPAIVQKRMGHSDIGTTLKYYVFNIDNGDKEAVKVYEEFSHPDIPGKSIAEPS